MKKMAGFLFVTLLPLTGGKVLAQDDRLLDCRSMENAASRLSCYDNLVDNQMEAASSVRSKRGLFRGISTDNPNFFGVAIPDRSDGRDDETHYEFNISIQQEIFEESLTSLKDHAPATLARFIPDRFAGIYNGRYDFYTGNERYDSSPIISREQNPGFAMEWDIGTAGNSKFRFAYFHLSNGQTLEREGRLIDGVPAYIGKDVFEQLVEEGGEDFALTQLSRSWNYYQLRYRQDNGFGAASPERRYFSAELRFFEDDRNEDVFWRVLSEQPKIEDFDGIRLEYERGFHLPLNLYGLGRVELKTGTSELSALENLSSRFSLGLVLDNTILSVFHFNGYGKEPSTYHLRTQYTGIGWEIR